jgi:hypothetical protein
MFTKTKGSENALRSEQRVQGIFLVTGEMNLDRILKY